MEPHSKSVTNVQRLPNVGTWNDSNTILRDYIKSFFSRKSTIFRLKRQMPTRKRVIILTPDDTLLVYETNCTGYSFDVRAAMRMKTSCYGLSQDAFEKSCTVTFKYNFGYVSLILVNDQISVWRRTLSTIFEGEFFDRSLITDLSLYTARDDELDDSFFSNGSVFEYTDSAISLKSAKGCTNISPSHTEATADQTQVENISLETNSNRSSTCFPLTIPSASSRASVISIRHENIKKTASNETPNQNQNPISIRHGANCVSFLAKKFETAFGRKLEKPSKQAAPCEGHTSSPLEVLFPPLPIQHLKDDRLKALREENGVEVSKFNVSGSIKNASYHPFKIEIDE